MKLNKCTGRTKVINTKWDGEEVAVGLDRESRHKQRFGNKPATASAVELQPALDNTAMQTEGEYCQYAQTEWGGGNFRKDKLRFVGRDFQEGLGFAENKGMAFHEGLGFAGMNEMKMVEMEGLGFV